MTGRTWELWGQVSHDSYCHVGEKWWVALHGRALPLVALLVEEWTGNPRDPEVTHYGWEYADKPGIVAMIHPRATSARMRPWTRLEMCFTYGMQIETDQGKGKMLALRITAHVPTTLAADPYNAS